MLENIRLSFQGISTVKEENLQLIKDLEEVESAACYLSRNYVDSIFYQNTALNSGAIYGIDSQYLDTCGYQITSGRGFIQEDMERFHKVVLLDSLAADSLFAGEDPIGKTIEIRSEPFIVVGIVAEKDGYEPVINSINDYYTYNQWESGALYIPITSWSILFYYDEPQNVVVQAHSTEEMSTAGREASDILSSGITNADGNISYQAAAIL